MNQAELKKVLDELPNALRTIISLYEKKTMRGEGMNLRKIQEEIKRVGKTMRVGSVEGEDELYVLLEALNEAELSVAAATDDAEDFYSKDTSKKVDEFLRAVENLERSVNKDLKSLKK